MNIRYLDSTIFVNGKNGLFYKYTEIGILLYPYKGMLVFPYLQINYIIRPKC